MIVFLQLFFLRFSSVHFAHSAEIGCKIPFFLGAQVRIFCAKFNMISKGDSFYLHCCLSRCKNTLLFAHSRGLKGKQTRHISGMNNLKRFLYLQRHLETLCRQLCASPLFAKGRGCSNENATIKCQSILRASLENRNKSAMYALTRFFLPTEKYPTWV